MKRPLLPLLCLGMSVPLLAGTNPDVERVFHEIDPTQPVISQDTQGPWWTHVSFDMFNVNMNYETTTTSNNQKTAKDKTFTGSLIGGTVRVGKGNWCVALANRSGDYDGIVEATDHEWAEDHDRSDTTIGLEYRYPEPWGESAWPFVYFGYLNQEVDKKKVQLTPGWTWTLTGTDTLQSTTQVHAFVAGIGASVLIWPDIGVGLRGDIYGLIGSADKTYQNVLPGESDSVSDMALGAIGTGTVYWMPTKWFNVQVGVQGNGFNFGDAGGQGYFGFFAKIGATIVF